MKKITKKLLSILMATLLLFSLSGCGFETQEPEKFGEDIKGSVADIIDFIGGEPVNNSEVTTDTTIASNNSDFDLSDIPEFTNKPYVTINENNPFFTKNEKKMKKSFESYSLMDSLDRCGVAFACVGRDIQPTEDRGSIGMIKPSGWHTVRYDCVDGGYLYNRCHLIGFQLTGENANEENLITGTRYMNVEGMLPFENIVDDYLEKYDNHVLYRVTPIFKKKELVARGVLMEAWSVEDNGKGVCFNVFCYNSQPEIKINYKTGESSLISESKDDTKDNSSKYIINKNTNKFHYHNCVSVTLMNPDNKDYFNGKRSVLIKRGYSPCGICNP